MVDSAMTLPQATPANLIHRPTTPPKHWENSLSHKI